MELQRRESSGARLGHVVPVQNGTESGTGGPAAPGTLVSWTAAELQLVGESEGSVREERRRGWIPGPRQHRRFRSERAVADRRLIGTGRWDGLDGLLLPMHARDVPDSL